MFFIYIGIACIYLLALSLRSAVLNIANALMLLTLCIDLCLLYFCSKKIKYNIALGLPNIVKNNIHLIYLKATALLATHKVWLIFVLWLYFINLLHAPTIAQSLTASLQFKAWLYIPILCIFILRFLTHYQTATFNYQLYLSNHSNKNATNFKSFFALNLIKFCPYILIIAFLSPHAVLWFSGLYDFIKYGNYINPNYYKQSPVMLSQVGCSIAFTALYTCMCVRTTYLKYSAFMVFLSASLAILFLGKSRTAYILYAFNLLLLIYWQRSYLWLLFKQLSLQLIAKFNIQLKYQKLMKIIFSFVCIGGFLSVTNYVINLPNINNRIEQVNREVTAFEQGDTKSNQRLRFWYISSQLIKQNFWLGFGNENFLTKFRAAEQIYDAKHIKEDFNHPHNEYLHIWLSFGLPGFLLYSLFWFFSYFRTYQLLQIYQTINQHNQTTQNTLKIILLAFLMFAIVNQILSACFNSISINMHSKEFFALCMALLWVLQIKYAASRYAIK